MEACESHQHCTSPFTFMSVASCWCIFDKRSHVVRKKVMFKCFKRAMLARPFPYSKTSCMTTELCLHIKVPCVSIKASKHCASASNAFNIYLGQSCVDDTYIK